MQGLDVSANRERISEVVEAMLKAGIETSLFIDPEPEQIELAAELRSPCIELHTGAFANAYFDIARRIAELERLRHGACLAHDLGITVNAGHGINYVNIALIRRIPWLHELNIGHSIISRALHTGIEEAVREMKSRMNWGRS